MTVTQQAFGFDGRIGRHPYFAGGVTVTVAGALLVALDGLVATAIGASVAAASTAGKVVAVPLAACVAWSSLALAARRLHDIGVSGVHGLWIVVLLIAAAISPYGGARLPGPHVGLPLPAVVLTLASVVVLGWLVFKRGQDGPNRYAPPPEQTAARRSLRT